MTGIVDYGVGNLYSLACSLKEVGSEACFVSDEKKMRECSRLILPGVGAFGDAAAKLNEKNLSQAVKEYALSGRPLLGICLGMQLLFDRSFEFGAYEGLGLIPGEIRPISPLVKGNKVPHIGWNMLIPGEKKSRLYSETDENAYVYFVHSYYACCDKKYASAYTEYGQNLTASAENGNVFGTQYHPEKSGKEGLKILKAFCEIRE